MSGDRDIVERLEDTECNRMPFTDEHAKCICRLTSAAAEEISTLRAQVEALREALVNEREECAKIVEGRVYETHYREWPQVGPGNSSKDSERTIFADALAKAIRARAALAQEGKAES